MLVLRAFRDAGCVSAGSPRLQTGGLQVCLWQTSSAQSCGLRRGASQPSSGGVVVKAAVRVSSGVPPFLFPFGLSARRRAERFGRWGAPREPSRAGGLGRGRRGGRLRWRRKNREPVAVVGRGRRWAAGVRAAGFSPAGNASFALAGQKSKPQNGEQKKTFRRPNVAVS